MAKILAYWILMLMAFTPVVVSRGEILFTISENAAKGFVIGQVLSRSGLISKYNATVIQSLEYSLMSRGSLPTDYFAIDNRTSELRVAKPIDRDNLCDLLMICCGFERTCQIPLSIVVQPIRGTFFVQTVKVKVEIIDVNDNEPKFQSRSIQGHISEVADIESTVTLPSTGNPLIASDRDSGPNSVKKYSIISPTGTFGLRIEEEFGVISDVAIVSKKELDREKIASYKVVVMAHDGGKPPKSGSVTVEIAVDDFNDHAPKFVNNTYSVWLSETAPLNTSVLTVKAEDKDSGLNADINYSIKNLPSDIVTRLFTINSITGQIRTKGRLNFEQQSTYRIKVEATDEGAFIRRKARTTVVVHLQDENDHGPLIKPGYLSNSDRAEVLESAQIGTFVAFLIVTDPDDDAVNCLIDNPMFKLRRSSSDPNEFHLLTAHELNRELSDSYQVTLTCTDQGQPQLKTAETFTVFVLDYNDNPPKFTQVTYTASITENNDLDIFLLEVRAHDLDSGENARIVYSLNEEGEDMFTINSASGRIYTKQVFNREKDDQIHFRVIARDNGTKPLYAEANVVIRIADENDNAPTFHNPNKFEISEAAGVGVMLGQVSASDPDIGRNAEITFSIRPDHDSRSFEITQNGVITTAVQLDRERQGRYHLIVVARDGGQEVVHSSSTTVTIVVTDVNDNPPIIHFPNTYNNTIYISYLEPVGHVVVNVNATDADSGRNALLDYSFTHGNEHKVFKLHQYTGAVQVARQLKKSDAIVYKLGIRVMDRADPFNTNVEVLNIVVDGTGKAIAVDGTYLDSIASNRNLIIVICLAVVSAVLAIILIVAIICIRRTDREQHLYNVQTGRGTETQKIYEQRQSSLPDKELPKYQPPIRRDINYPTEVDDSYNHVNGHHSPVYSSLRSQNWKSSVYPKSLEV